MRKIDSDLEGHPTPRLEFVDVATGSLGQGLSCAAGIAFTGKYIDRASYRVFCLLGDGEMAEGSVYEALSPFILLVCPVGKRIYNFLSLERLPF